MNNMRTLLNIPGCFISLQFVFLAAKLHKDSKLYRSGWAWRRHAQPLCHNLELIRPACGPVREGHYTARRIY